VEGSGSGRRAYPLFTGTQGSGNNDAELGHISQEVGRRHLASGTSFWALGDNPSLTVNTL